MRILLVDVDLVVAPSDVFWREVLAEKYGYVKCPMTKYNFAQYYPHAKDAYEFWKNLDYFDMQPLDHSVSKLEQLSKYFSIVFVSAEKCGYNSKNKKSWLKEHYKFLTGYVCTEEKYLLNSDKVVAMIDDRLDNLEGFDHHKRVHFKTIYEQSSNCGVGYVIDDWESFNVADFCKQYLN